MFKVEGILDSKKTEERGRALSGLLERADLLARAVYFAAAERGYWQVSDAYRSRHPEVKKAWDRYASARAQKESLSNQLFGFVSPKKPHELSRYNLRSRRAI